MQYDLPVRTLVNARDRHDDVVVGNAQFFLSQDHCWLKRPKKTRPKTSPTWTSADLNYLPVYPTKNANALHCKKPSMPVITVPAKGVFKEPVG